MVVIELTAMTNAAEEELAAQARASLDAQLREVERQIAGIALPEIPHPDSGTEHPRKATAVIQALNTEIDQLCAQRERNAREAQHWMMVAERAVRINDDAAAKEALVRHGAHLKLFQEADVQVTEFRALITEVQRALSLP